MWQTHERRPGTFQLGSSSAYELTFSKICLAPDFVLVTKGHQATFIEALRKQLAIFHPEGSLKSNSFGRIVSPTHFARLKGLLDRTKGKIVAGGETDEKSLKIALTIVADVTGDDSLMSE